MLAAMGAMAGVTAVVDIHRAERSDKSRPTCPSVVASTGSYMVLGKVEETEQ